MYLNDKDKNVIVKFITDKLNVEFIYLFGSFARGEAREDSDIDIAVFSIEKLNSYELFVLANHLSFELKRDVQIIDLKSITTVFAAQIVTNKEMLYSNSEENSSKYDVKILKEYAKLNEERDIVLKRIKKDGKIYG